MASKSENTATDPDTSSLWIVYFLCFRILFKFLDLVLPGMAIGFEIFNIDTINKLK